MDEITNRRIIVVDDDPANRDSMKALLESAGLDANVFCSAEEMLGASDLHDHNCLLLDINLPGVDGIEATKILARKSVDIPVILITGHAELADKARSGNTGAIAVFEKPLNDQVLLDTVARAVSKRFPST
jgi:FixJ family two-component response regulator